MKFLIFSLTLTLLASCGKNAPEKTSKNDSESNSIERESGYGMPKIGFHKTVNLNYNLEWIYEFMTVNPNGNEAILGDRPFYLEINEDNEVQIRFYSDHYLKSVSYIDLGSKFDTTVVKHLNQKTGFVSMLKPIEDFYREFTYGNKNPESPEQDMLNKVFVIETQEKDHPYKSSMKLMIWLECHGGLRLKSKFDYTCEGDALKFNYKLLDYKLEKEI